MKDRDISILDFFKALQREFISLEIRSKIYISKKNKEYFWKLMAKKKDSILSLAHKNNLPNVIEDEDEYIVVWKEIVPKFGFPKLIYNIVGLTEDQLKFPYHGSVVKVGSRYGISHRVNFDDHTVDVILYGEDMPIPFNKVEVERLNHKKTDEYFYYYPGNQFNVSEKGIGLLVGYDIESGLAQIKFESGEIQTVANEFIARIL